MSEHRKLRPMSVTELTRMFRPTRAPHHPKYLLVFLALAAPHHLGSRRRLHPGHPARAIPAGDVVPEDAAGPAVLHAPEVRQQVVQLHLLHPVRAGDSVRHRDCSLTESEVGHVLGTQRCPRCSSTGLSATPCADRAGRFCWRVALVLLLAVRRWVAGAASRLPVRRPRTTTR